MDTIDNLLAAPLKKAQNLLLFIISEGRRLLIEIE